MPKNFKELGGFLKKYKIAFVSGTILLINIIVAVQVFNETLKKTMLGTYEELVRFAPAVPFLGWLGLLGKNARIAGRVMPLKDLPVIKNANQMAFFAIIGVNFLIFLFWIFFGKGKKKNNSHGSAKWGGLEEIDFKPGNDKYFGITLRSDKGVVLGRFKGITLRDNMKTHICITAPTRTGKGVSIIIPTLIDSWNESVIVLDIKGENYQLTSGARKEKFDNTILRLAPKSENSCGYNPLGEIRFLSQQEMEDVRLIVDIIMADDSAGGGAKDPYWNTSAADLLLGIIFYVMTKKFLENPKYVIEGGVKKPVSTASMVDVVNFITDPNYDAPIKEILMRKAQEEDLIEEYGRDEETKRFVRDRLMSLYGTDADIINKGRHPMAARYMAEKGNLPETTLGSIIGSAKVKLSIFEIPIVKQNTDHSDFRIYDLMNYKKPVSLYLVVPPADILSLSPLIKMLLLQAVNILTPEIDYANQTGHKWRMLMLLDEFPAIGKLEVLEKGIGYVAGYGMKMMLILQSLDQLFKIYGKENGFLSNCQAQIFYTSNDETTANYVSKLLGKETIEQFTQSNKSVGTIIKSESQQFIGKDLLSPDEVGRFPSDKIIVKLSGRNPIQSDKIVYFQEPEYANLTKIPYVYSESCYDTTKQYIKLTDEQRKKYPDYPYKYMPYESALKKMQDDLNKEYARIKSITKEQRQMFDEIEEDNYKASLRNYQKNNAGFKKYIKLYNELVKTDPRFASTTKKKEERRSVIKEQAEERVIKLKKDEVSEIDKIMRAGKLVNPGNQEEENAIREAEARKENISDNIIENLQVQETENQKTNIQREDYITEMIDNIENIQKETSEQHIEAEESSMDFGNSDENEDSEEKNNSNIEEEISENINTNISESVDFDDDEWETAQ